MRVYPLHSSALSGGGQVSQLAVQDRQGLKIYQSLSRVTLFFLFAFLSTHKPEASCLFNNYNYFIAGNINTAVLLIWTCVFFEIHADFNDKETNRPAILHCLHFLNNSFFWQFWSAALTYTGLDLGPHSSHYRFFFLSVLYGRGVKGVREL